MPKELLVIMLQIPQQPHYYRLEAELQQIPGFYIKPDVPPIMVLNIIMIMILQEPPLKVMRIRLNLLEKEALPHGFS